MAHTSSALLGAVTNERDEKARLAVSEFRRLQPTLTAYARVLTGRRDVRVEIATRDNGSTDGTRIFFRPPIAMGDKTPHERSLCDKRDSTGHKRCPACKTREEVMCTIMHEIGHIAFKSFAELSDVAKRSAIEFAVKEVRSEYGDKVRERIKRAPEWRTKDMFNLSGLINEFLPFIINSLEDARVDSQMFLARPGLKSMFYADTVSTFENGYEVRNNRGFIETVFWNEAPLNHQMIVGVFVKASGYKYEGWFSPRVEESLNDEELTRLTDQVLDCKDAEAILNLSFKVLARLRELGYCATPQDPDPEPQPEPEENEDEESDDSEESSDPSPQEGDEAVDEAEGSDQEDSDPGESGGRNSSESEESEDSGHDEDEAESGGGDPSNEDGAEGSAGEDSDAEEEGEPVDGDEDETESQAGSGDGDEPGADEGDQGDSDPEGSSGDGEGDSSLPSSVSDGGTGEEGSDDSSDDASGDGAGKTDGSDLPDDDNSDDSGRAPSASDDRESDGDDSDDEDLVDTGADDGYGGTQVDSQPDYGTPEDLKPLLDAMNPHHEKPKSMFGSEADEEAVDTAIVQGLYFTHPSTTVRGVREHFYDKPTPESKGWQKKSRKWDGSMSPDMPDDATLQPAIGAARRTFSDNQRGANDRNRKSGKVDPAVLGRRAWSGDERLFHRRTRPGKRSYFVVIGVDMSGSTVGVNLAIEKKAVMAQAELLDRVGIPFAIYGHTGDYTDRYSSSDHTLSLEIYHVKDANEPWNDKTRQRLADIRPCAANLDGHALEYLRKRAEESRATDTIILYYSDGKMPQENHDEELEILQENIALCRARGYTLLGVGIRTDSPQRHGLDTVQLDDNQDITKVVEHLGKRLKEK